MDAIISDITGKTVAKLQSYKVDIFNRSTGCHIEIDASMDELNENKFAEAIACAIRNGVQWYKIQKDSEGRWQRVKITQEGQGQIA